MLVAVGVALLLLSGALAWAAVGSSERVVLVALPAPVAPVLPPLDPDTVALPVTIRRGATFGGLARSLDLPADAVRAAALPHYDLARIRPDRELSVLWSDGVPDPIGLRYAIDEDVALVVRRDGDAWVAEIDEVAYTVAPGARAFEIRRSLWQDGLAAGLRPGGLVRLAAIFEYELDFNTELQPGATFTLVADVRSAPDRRPRLGDIHAVRLTNGDRSWTVFRHVLPDGGEGWYREDGTSLRKPFLRSPLEFSRVTSGFNPRRFHPILKQTRPHNGTDFGAPTGTPVRAVADGKVVRAGWAGGHGRFVKIEHEGGFATSYSHLSRVDVVAGRRVRQGETVGAVGASGLATGPHLHYQMWRNGKYVDPMRVDLPNQAPLPASERGAFEQVVARWAPALDAPEVLDPSTVDEPVASDEVEDTAGDTAGDDEGR